MPYLVQIEQDYGTHGVTVLALNFKEDADPLAHLEERGLDLRVFLDADSVAEAWGIRFSPGLLVVDGNGVVVYQRRSTDKPPGKAIAEYWSDQVRDAFGWPDCRGNSLIARGIRGLTHQKRPAESFFRRNGSGV